MQKIYHLFFEKLIEKPKFSHFYLSIFEKIYLKIFKSSYNISQELNHNINILDKYNLDINQCKNTLSENNLDFESDRLSWHYHFFSSIKDENIKILEIGTHKGEFTRFLSNNLPNSTIHTIDVESSDHKFLEAYQDDKKNQIEFIKKRNENLNSQNINFKELNSFYLLDHFKNEEFDYIWLDGDHLNPQVTIDIFSCLKIIKKNGLILCDDVIKSDYFDTQINIDTYNVLLYLKKMGLIHYDLLNKRITKYNAIIKKHIAIIKKQ